MIRELRLVVETADIMAILGNGIIWSRSSPSVV